MKDLNCYLHTALTADCRCAKCGAPICATCYDITTIHHCAKCYRKELGKEAKLAKETLQKVRGELKGIYIGIIVGAVLSVATTILLYLDRGASVLPLCLFWGFFGSMLCGSFGVLTDVLFNGMESAGEDGWLLGVFALIALVAVAPVTTIVRIVRRKRDIRKISDIYEMDNNVIHLVEDYVAQAQKNNTTSTPVACGCANSPQISAPTITAACASPGFKPGENEETLTRIRKRII